MQAFLLQQGEYLLRIIVATLCGMCVGLERESNMKLAGVRTYSIVALTSSLMMILSKYGFYDVLTQSNVSLDPSRIAASIVTAIGFLGAGVIFTRKMNVSGLVTAASIWATVGIGSAIGAGLYLCGIFSTAFFLLLQLCYHKIPRIGQMPTVERIVLLIDDTEDVHHLLHRIFIVKKIKISNISVARVGNHQLRIKLYVKFPFTYKVEDIVSLLKDTPEINSIDV
ncbi:MAG: MgtC/SapB family protein [Ruminococcus sp.]|jgi:putative Mg2+ transporter-C (MgtC) family protein